MIEVILLAAIDLGLGSADARIEALSAFRRSQSYPVYIRECSALYPEMQPSFDSAFKEWKKRNKAAISAGREIIEEEGHRTRTNTMAMSQGTAGLAFDLIRDEPADKKMEFCTRNLSEMSQ